MKWIKQHPGATALIGIGGVILLYYVFHRSSSSAATPSSPTATPTWGHPVKISVAWPQGSVSSGGSATGGGTTVPPPTSTGTGVSLGNYMPGTTSGTLPGGSAWQAPSGWAKSAQNDNCPYGYAPDWNGRQFNCVAGGCPPGQVATQDPTKCGAAFETSTNAPCCVPG